MSGMRRYRIRVNVHPQDAQSCVDKLTSFEEMTGTKGPTVTALGDNLSAVRYWGHGTHHPMVLADLLHQHGVYFREVRELPL
jgi:hypothetical protein